MIGSVSNDLMKLLPPFLEVPTESRGRVWNSEIIKKDKESILNNRLYTNILQIFLLFQTLKRYAEIISWVLLFPDPGSIVNIWKISQMCKSTWKTPRVCQSDQEMCHPGFSKCCCHKVRTHKNNLFNVYKNHVPYLFSARS